MNGQQSQATTEEGRWLQQLFLSLPPEEQKDFFDRISEGVLAGSMRDPMRQQVEKVGGRIISSRGPREAETIGGEIPQYELSSPAPAPMPTASELALERLRGTKAPAPQPVSFGRKLGAAGAAFAAALRQPGRGIEVGQMITQAPYRRELAKYQTELGQATREYGMAREQERMGLEKTREAREAEAHKRTMGAPVPETPAAAFERKKAEAVKLGLQPGTPEYNEYISGRELGLRPPAERNVQVEDFYEGGKVIKKRYDQATKTWIPIGEGKPDRGEQARPATPGERQSAESRKDKALRQMEQKYRWNAERNLYIDVTDPLQEKYLTQDEFTKQKQQIQVAYENELRALGEKVTPFTYEGQPAPATAATATPPAAAAAPTAAKQATRQQVERFAATKGMSYEQAKAGLEAAGYKIIE